LSARQNDIVACRVHGRYLILNPSVKEGQTIMPQTHPSRAAPHAFVRSVHGIRYQVKDVARSVAFYTQHLGFTLEHQHLPAFANVSLGDVAILLSGPGASGSRPMPNGRSQEPGGWNRIVLRVSDLPAGVAALKSAGVRFRNEMETGPGGRQIQIEDPDGNPIELFEPAT
jgi:glyoxylase I family protein